MKVWVHIVDGEPVEVRLGGNNVEEEIFQQKVEAHLQDWGWTYEAINELFSAGDLYDKMKTEKGRAEVENILRDYAEEEVEQNDCEDWFELTITE